jgi:hypothetical protein
MESPVKVPNAWLCGVPERSVGTSGSSHLLCAVLSIAQELLSHKKQKRSGAEINDSPHLLWKMNLYNWIEYNGQDYKHPRQNLFFILKRDVCGPSKHPASDES